MATMPATFWVPLRRSRSWPPPWMRGPTVRSRGQDQRADPLGAPELVGADRHQVGPPGQPGRVQPGHGLDGVGVEDGVGRARPHQRGHLGEGLDGADLVVDGHHRHQPDLGRARLGQGVEVDEAVLARPAPRAARPRCAGPAPGRCRARRGAPWPRTPGRWGDGRPPDPASQPPTTARLSASVPPEVNTTSPRSAPNEAATRWRASSTARRARRDSRWPPDGLPNVPPR